MNYNLDIIETLEDGRTLYSLATDSPFDPCLSVFRAQDGTLTYQFQVDETLTVPQELRDAADRAIKFTLSGLGSCAIVGKSDVAPDAVIVEGTFRGQTIRVCVPRGILT